MEKRNWFLFMIGYFTAGYLTINWISSQRSMFFDVSIVFDHAIPFVAPFIFGYILVYLSLLLTYLIINNMDDWRRTVISFLAVTTLAFIFFLAFPVKMSLRPEMQEGAGISSIVTYYYYIIDKPFNCFPSLHVAYPLLATLLVWRNHKTMRWIIAAMTVVVAISVVFVKQHYIMDVLGGILNAGFCFWLTVKFENRWEIWFGRWFSKKKVQTLE